MQITDNMEKLLEERCVRLGDSELAQIYRNCFRNTWETTLTRREEKSYVITGDIEAMWLRDSSLQVAPYLHILEDAEVAEAVRGLIWQQAEQVLTDPYANAFNQKGDYSCYSKDHTEMGPYIWERKYEVDSLAFHLYLLEEYYSRTQDASVVNEAVKRAAEKILEVWKTEQNHETESPYLFERDSELVTETLQNHGKGTKTGYTGMTWSGFRPSDDACTYHYLVPSNMLAVCVLKRLSILPLTEAVKERAAELAAQIEEGIYKFGTVMHPVYGKIFVYETDGLGSMNLMDDANLPSLLSAPWFGFCDSEDPVYVNTRKFILSKENPYYYEGKYGRGVGSPHTPCGYIWPIALSMQGLTAAKQEEKADILEILKNTTGGTWFMHESFHPDAPEKFTRDWFAWANSMFCLLVDQYFKF